MSEIRSVSVHLDADVAGYIAKMRLAGAETDKAFGRSNAGIASTNASLGRTETSLSKVESSARKTSTEIDRLGSRVESTRVKVDNGSKAIDRYSGRLGLLISGLSAVGPAAIPLTAIAIPAVTALGGGILDLAAGVGVGLLAFHGLGDALTKFNKASLEPTATNIAAAEAAMNKLPPATQALVVQLHQLGPEVDKLRQAAAGGFAPGVTDGLHSLLSDAPLVRQAIRGISGELGQMARETGDALASDQWRPFIRFIGNTAPHEMHVLGSATGDVAHGLAELFMAFGPLNSSVDSGILKLAQDFDRWATSLGKTKDFQAFVAYIETNGPRVVDLLGDVSQLFVDIVQAAAPLGGPTIQVLDLLVRALDQLASSPLATPLLALGQIYAVVRLLSRGYDSLTTSSSRTFGSKYLSGQKAAVAGLFEVTSAQDRARLSAQELAAAESERSAANRATLLKGGAALAGFAFLATGAADKVGLTNTATLAMAGSLAGPWGAAVGGAIGFTMDLAHAQDGLADSAKAATKAFDTQGSSIDFSAQAKSLSDLQTNIASADKARSDFFASSGSSAELGGALKEGVTLVSDFFSHTREESKATADQLAVDNANIRTAFGSLFEGLGGKTTNEFGQSQVTSIAQLQATATAAAPAMESLGISVDDLQSAAAAGDGSLDVLVHRIVAFVNQADSAAGRSHAVADAFAEMSDQTLTADQRVQGLTDALDGLIDPMLNLGQAKDAFHQGLNDITKSLASDSRALTGNTDAAITNRNAIRTQVSNLKQLVEAQANVPGAQGKMTATLKAGRQAILNAADAAGLNRAQVQHMIDTMGLTPKLIKTVIQLNGADAALSQARAVASALNALHDRTIRITTVRTTGGRSVAGNADGGTIPGPRYPYGDKVLRLVAPGEEVISNRRGQADRWRPLLKAINSGGMADGGTVSSQRTQVLVGGDGVGAAAKGAAHELHGLRLELHNLTLQSHALGKEIDDEKAKRSQIISNQQQLASAVADNFRSQIFGVSPDTSSGIWAGGRVAATDPTKILRQNIRDATAFERDIRRLRRRGLRGGALAEIDTLDEAQQALGLSRREDRQITRLFDIRQRRSQQAGELQGQFRFGHALAESNKHLHRLEDKADVANDRLKAVEAAIKHQEAEQKKNAKDTGKAVGDALNHTTARGARRAR